MTYSTIINAIDEIFRTLYSAINHYFENIFNSPSTINRIITYYAIGLQDGVHDKRFIMFNGKVVREYKISYDANDKMVKIYVE